MALHDQERRTPRAYMHHARTRYHDTGASSKWIAFMAGIGLIALVVFIFAAGADDTINDAITQKAPTTTTAPTNTPAPSTK